MLKAKAKAKRPRSSLWEAQASQAGELLASIVSFRVEAHELADAKTWVALPFPHLSRLPKRFLVDSNRRFEFMGRTGYAHFRNTVLGLYPNGRSKQLGLLPVRAEIKLHDTTAVLWGTMGSGKSHMLAALACDLLASFHRHSKDSDGFQQQRIVYIPDSRHMLGMSCADAFKDALYLSYAGDLETTRRISMITNETIMSFFKEEAEKGVLLYVMVDQMNALETSDKDAPNVSQQKTDATGLINYLASYHIVVTSASANNQNASRWYSSKELDKAVVFHHGGLDDQEYKSWKEHFKATPLAQLLEDEEQRVKDATGCVPLFLRCWSNAAAIEKKTAWELFIQSPEIMLAEDQLREFITTQLQDPVHSEDRIRMYTQFLTQGQVNVHPDRYDCRYLFIKNGIGRCVCGVYRDLVAQLLQQYQSSAFLKGEWGEAISRETAKEMPNLSLLGFMVEEEMISEIMRNGIPLYGKKVMKCTKLRYFKTEEEAHLAVEEGCILYLPHTFNYHRVDAVVREYIKSNKLYDGDSPKPEHLLKVYHMLQLQVAGVQITIGSLDNHLHSEEQFCAPDATKVWHPGFDSQNVGVWFIWYVLRSEMEKHTREAAELFKCAYGEKDIIGKTRAQKIKTLHHVALFYPVEDYEPRLEALKKT